MTKPVLLAGLLGGVLGAIICFALLRAFPSEAKSAAPTNPTLTAPPTVPQDGRAFADDLVAKLKDRKDEELKSRIRLAYRELNDEEFNKGMWEPFLQARTDFANIYGKSLSIELARENVVSQDIVRFTYLERHEHGCGVWSIVCYNSPSGWQVIGFRHLKVEVAFEMLK